MFKSPFELANELCREFNFTDTTTPDITTPIAELLMPFWSGSSSMNYKHDKDRLRVASSV